MLGVFTALIAEGFWTIGSDQKMPSDVLTGEGESTLCDSRHITATSTKQLPYSGETSST